MTFESFNFFSIVPHCRALRRINESQPKYLGLSQTEKDLIKILKKSTTEPLIEISTFLKERDKIEVKFLKNNYQDPNSYDTEDTIELTLEELTA